MRNLLLLALLFPAALHAGVIANPQGARGPSTVNFNVQPYEVLERYTAAQGRMNDALKTLLQVPAGQRTFANTVLPLEKAGAEFGEAITQLVFLAYVSPNAELQEAAQMVEEDAGKFSVSLGAREDLYEAIKEVADAKPELSVEDQRLLDSSMLGFKHAGMGLDLVERAKLTALQQRLSQLETQFSTNLNKIFPGLELTETELKGLPEDYVQRLKKTDEGKYKVTLAYPDYVPFMRLAESSELRRQLQLKYKTRAADENGPLLVEAINIRHNIAKTLGYPSYPHMNLIGRTAETPEKVWDFLTRLRSIVSAQGAKEEAAILEQKRQTEPGATKVESWESGYFSDKLKKRLYGYDPEEVKKYFPVDRVIAGTMKVYQDLFHVTFTEVSEPQEGQRWHGDAKLYQITDRATGEEIGHFYMDLHPREGKYGHAAAFSLVKGRALEEGGYRQPVSAMVANFPAPSPGKPALVPFGDVETFFHEFGHIMHQTLTRARHGSQSGSSVARDFVEAPSQMLENFVWDRRVIDLISGHFEDGSKKLPEELFAKMKEAKGFNQSIGYLGQLAYAMADMTLHAAVPADTSALFNIILRMVTGEVAQPGSRADASFGHLMGGYDAGYYGYLWSLVYAEDIFSVFAANGVLSPETGLRYRRTILEKGSSQPEMVTLKEFLQREPSEKAFLEGISPKSADDRYWALRRIISERAKLFTEADEIDGLDVHLKDGQLWFRIVLWPESMGSRTEADVIEIVRKKIPEMADLEVRFSWLGVGA